MKPRTLLLILVLAVIAASIALIESRKPPQLEEPGALEEQFTEQATEGREAIVAEKAGKYEFAKEIAQPAGFINTEPFTLAEHIGKQVILVDFWTYSCINCQRTFPFLNAWYDTYTDQGLVIVGVHSPEFAFEKEYENVQKAVERFGIKYPVVLDNDFATWRSYRNQFWPRKYLIDIDGYIVYDHIGEGAYGETERRIQELLRERREVLGLEMELSDDMAKPEGVETVDFSLLSPEIYFGALRNEHLANGEPLVRGRQELRPLSTISPNSLYLVGPWNFEDEYAENLDVGARVIFRYRGKSVNLVAAPTSNLVRFRVLLDGQPVGSAAGDDVRSIGGLDKVEVTESRLYNLIETDDYGEHTLELLIENPGLRAFTFTFG